MAFPDTAQRSLEHWSEAGRAEMRAFYALATEDYRELATARDWAADLRAQATDGHVRLLDVACGSGKFPAALLANGLPAAARDLTVAVDLLDPSAFSIAEARAVLAAPFEAATEYEIPLQDFDVRARYDLAWATHALYALPPRNWPRGWPGWSPRVRVVPAPTMISGDWQKFIPGAQPGEVVATDCNRVIG